MIQFNDSRMKVLITFIIVLYAFVFTGCRTGPDFAEQNYPGVIADDGRLLVHFNLLEDRVLLDNFLSKYSTSDLSSITDRTERLSISIDSLGSDPNFSILAEGSYPKFITNLAIGREDNWIKHRDKYVWWENEVDGLFISVPNSSVALISNSSLTSILSSIESGSRKYIPHNVKEEFGQAVMTVYSRFPGVKFYEAFNIPEGKRSVQEMFFITKNDGYNYNISGVLEFTNESDARIFSSALKLGLFMKLRESGKAVVMKIVHDSRIEAVNSIIIMDNILLDSDEMIELIGGSSKALEDN